MNQMSMADYISELQGFVSDVNPAEIANQIERDNLSTWCYSWQAAILKAICKPIQPPVEVKLRTNEDILSVDEAIETINRLRKAYRKQKIVVRCRDCEKYNAPVVSRDTAVCGRFDCLVEPDGYCSYGKRRAE